MGRRSVNGMTNDVRYEMQQRHIDDVAQELRLVVYRPDYHGAKNDANTVLVYLTDDAAHNAKVDKQMGRYRRSEAERYHITDSRYIYRDYLWAFENTDANGNTTFLFANRGKLDLRGTDWDDVIEGSIQLAYYRKLQRRYAAGCGGYLGISESDSNYCDLNRKIIEACRKAYRHAFMGSINYYDDMRKEIAEGAKSVYKEYTGQPVYNFGCDFIVPTQDKALEDLIRAWNGPQQDYDMVDKITTRIEEIGGELLIWY